MNLKITFTIRALPCCFVSCGRGRKTMEVEAADGLLSVAAVYDYDRRPLRLQGEVKAGDTMELLMSDHRIELYVNGKLVDEEWPAGKRLFEMGDPIWPDADVTVEQVSPQTPHLPAVISTFENAEGWRPEKNVFVGDCMPYRKDDEYHILYLKDRRHHQSKWGLGAHQWEHISTKDFKCWRVHPMAVPITDPQEGSICTGSWIRNEGKEYLFYTVRRGRGLPNPICRSVSDDGYHFVKDASFGFTLPEKYKREKARDPKVVRGEDGLFHMFLTTTLLSAGRGCLVHLTSADLDRWEEAGEPIYLSPNADEPECPDYFQYQSKYYLIFSLRGTAYYMISQRPFDGFVLPAHPIIPCASVPKGAEWNGRLIFAGFQQIGAYAGNMTFKAATAKENGELVFEDL